MVVFIAIAQANDVEVDVAHNSTYVIAYGMPDDIDLVEALWLNVAPRMIAEANGCAADSGGTTKGITLTRMAGGAPER
jgi:hypothetical protein